MKKLTLLMLVLSISLFLNNILAQPCTPGNYTASGIYPDSIPGLPPAYVDSVYNSVITVVVPTDTFMFAQTLIIDSIGIYSVTGLPAGFAYSTNPINGYIHGGASGCVLISGTPTLAQVGSYPINITMDSWVNGLPQGFFDTRTGYYTINITIPVSIENKGEAINEVHIYPNPFSKETTLNFASSVDENISLCIYNNIGQLIYSETINAYKGKNAHVLKLDAENGIYYYTITGTDSFLQNKMIISN